MSRVSLAQDDRQTARRASIPLGLVAVAFLLPTYRSCTDGAILFPAEFVRDAASVLLILPVYLCAGALALLTTRALLQRKMDLQTRRLGLGFVLLLVVTNAATLYLAWRGSPEGMAVALASIILAVIAIRSARGHPPWRIWDRLLLAFTFSASGSFPPLFLGAECFRGSRDDLGVGAYLLLSSLAALLLVMGNAAARGRSTQAS